MPNDFILYQTVLWNSVDITEAVEGFVFPDLEAIQTNSGEINYNSVVTLNINVKLLQGIYGITSTDLNLDDIQTHVRITIKYTENILNSGKDYKISTYGYQSRNEYCDVLQVKLFSSAYKHMVDNIIPLSGINASTRYLPIVMNLYNVDILARGEGESLNVPYLYLPHPNIFIRSPMGPLLYGEDRKTKTEYGINILPIDKVLSSYQNDIYWGWQKVDISQDSVGEIWSRIPFSVYHGAQILSIFMHNNKFYAWLQGRTEALEWPDEYRLMQDTSSFDGKLFYIGTSYVPQNPATEVETTSSINYSSMYYQKRTLLSSSMFISRCEKDSNWDSYDLQDFGWYYHVQSIGPCYPPNANRKTIDIYYDSEPDDPSGGGSHCAIARERWFIKEDVSDFLILTDEPDEPRWKYNTDSQGTSHVGEQVSVDFITPIYIQQPTKVSYTFVDEPEVSPYYQKGSSKSELKIMRWNLDRRSNQEKYLIDGNLDQINTPPGMISIGDYHSISTEEETVIEPGWYGFAIFSEEIKLNRGQHPTLTVDSGRGWEEGSGPFSYTENKVNQFKLILEPLNNEPIQQKAVSLDDSYAAFVERGYINNYTMPYSIINGIPYQDLTIVNLDIPNGDTKYSSFFDSKISVHINSSYQHLLKHTNGKLYCAYIYYPDISSKKINDALPEGCYWNWSCAYGVNETAPAIIIKDITNRDGDWKYDSTLDHRYFVESDLQPNPYHPIGNYDIQARDTLENILNNGKNDYIIDSLGEASDGGLLLSVQIKNNPYRAINTKVNKVGWFYSDIDDGGWDSTFWRPIQGFVKISGNAESLGLSVGDVISLYVPPTYRTDGRVSNQLTYPVYHKIVSISYDELSIQSTIVIDPPPDCHSIFGVGTNKVGIDDWALEYYNEESTNIISDPIYCSITKPAIFKKIEEKERISQLWWIPITELRNTDGWVGKVNYSIIDQAYKSWEETVTSTYEEGTHSIVIKANVISNTIVLKKDNKNIKFTLVSGDEKKIYLDKAISDATLTYDYYCVDPYIFVNLSEPPALPLGYCWHDGRYMRIEWSGESSSYILNNAYEEYTNYKYPIDVKSDMINNISLDGIIAQAYINDEPVTLYSSEFQTQPVIVPQNYESNTTQDEILKVINTLNYYWFVPDSSFMEVMKIIQSNEFNYIGDFWLEHRFPGTKYTYTVGDNTYTLYSSVGTKGFKEVDLTDTIINLADVIYIAAIDYVTKTSSLPILHLVTTDLHDDVGVDISSCGGKLVHIPLSLNATTSSINLPLELQDRCLIDNNKVVCMISEVVLNEDNTQEWILFLIPKEVE